MAMAMALWLLLASLALSSSASAEDQKNVTANPADELIAVLNTNRTGHNSSALYDNPGLACIALQYIKAYQGKCGDVGGSDAKKPADSEFAQLFAPNCGITVSTLSQITGRLLGCQTKYVQASEAFSEILITSTKSLDVLHSKNHTEVGAGVSGTDGGSPYFWCILFSNGSTNGSFAFEGGVAKTTKPGCYSGANDTCSGAGNSSPTHNSWPFAISALISLSYVLGL